MNSNVPRWIKTSIRKYFTDGGSPLYLYCLGDDRQHPEPVTRGELRWDGPNFTFHNRHDYDVKLDLSLLLQVAKSDTDADILERTLGPLILLFKASIPIYRNGTGEEDDQSLIGCFVPQDDVQLEFFDAKAALKALQGTIQCSYMMSVIGED